MDTSDTVICIDEEDQEYFILLLLAILIITVFSILLQCSYMESVSILSGQISSLTRATTRLTVGDAHGTIGDSVRYRSPVSLDSPPPGYTSAIDNV